MVHSHFFTDVQSIGLNPVKCPLGNQPLQDHVSVRKPLGPLLNALGSLHTGMKDKVPKMEIVSSVMIPRLPGAIVNTGYHVGSRAVGGVGMASGNVTPRIRRPGHTRDGVVLVSSPDPVFVVYVARHDQRRWRSRYTTSPMLLILAYIQDDSLSTIPGTHLEFL